MREKSVNRLRVLVRAAYKELLVERYRDRHFWILSAFIPTFLIARLLVHFFPNMFVDVNGHHIHHFTFGFVILAISGYLAIVREERSPAWLAALFGIGLALAVDEAGMWLHLTNHYYNETSENIIVLTFALLINLAYFRRFWIRLLRVTFKWLVG